MTYAYAGILIGFLLVCYIHQSVLNHADLQLRLQRFYATMISKKFFAWFFVTGLFIFDSYIKDPPREWLIEYLSFTCGVFVIDVSQKYAGLKGKDQ